MKFQKGERVLGRSNEDSNWNICKVIDCFIPNIDNADDIPEYNLLDCYCNTFYVYEDTCFIRKFIDNPVNRIKQSIEYGDNANDIEYLIKTYQLDINLIYKDIFEVSLLYGNLSVLQYLNSVNYISSHDYDIFDSQGRSIIHIASLRKDHRLLYGKELECLLGNRDRVFKALDGKKKSLLHYIVTIDNIDYLKYFVENDLIHLYDLYRYTDNDKVSMLEWEDVSGKTPIQYAQILKRSEILQILQQELVNVNVTCFIEDLNRPDITLEQTEQTRSKYSFTNDSNLSIATRLKLRALLFCSSADGSFVLLKYFAENFVSWFNECKNYHQSFAFSYYVPSICQKYINYRHEKITEKLCIAHNLLTAVVIGDINQNLHMLVCDLSHFEEYSEFSGDEEYSDYFRINFDRAYESYSHYNHTCILSWARGFGETINDCPFWNTEIGELISKYLPSAELKDGYSFHGYFTRLNEKHKILLSIYVSCKLKRVDGIRVESRRETLRYLVDYHDFKLPPLSLFVEIGQLPLLFGWYSFSALVDDDDLQCLSSEKIRKVFLQSKLECHQLGSLTKGQFCIIYSILVDEVASLVALVNHDDINEDFSFGVYDDMLHFR